MKLICYLSLGTPNLNSSLELVELYLDSGCDVIEIDMPARDPYLEGELISGLMTDALARCNDYKEYMDALSRIRKRHPRAHFILLMYEQTIDEIGYCQFIDFCHQNQFRDMILVGQKGPKVMNQLIKDGISVSSYVQFRMEAAEIKAAQESNGFVYMQAKPRQEKEINPNYPSLKDCIHALRRKYGIKNPIYCGVGIHGMDDIRMAKDSGADGVFVGSSILKLYQQPIELGKKIKEFKKNCR